MSKSLCSLLLATSLIHTPIARAHEAPTNRRAPTADEPTAKGDIKKMPREIGGERPDRAEHAEMVAQLWLTPLGKMFRHFLYDTDPKFTPSELSHQIIDRIHGDVRMTLTRTSALSMMIEDLYNAAELTPVVHTRVALLNMGMDVRRVVAQNTSSSEYLRFLPLFILTGFAAGSPLVKEKVAAIGQDIWTIIKATFGRQSTVVARQALRQHAGLGELFTRKIFKDYGIMSGLLGFQAAFSYGYLFYYVARTGSADAVAVQNKIWVYGLQRFVNFEEI